MRRWQLWPVVGCVAACWWAAQGSGGPTEPPAGAHQVGYRRQEFKFTAGGEPGTRQLDLWYPTLEKEQRHDYHGQIGFAAEGAAVAPGPHPLILFSHGFLGTSDQSIFLTEACARAGYVVAAMNHLDSLGTRKTQRLEPPNFAEFATWTDAKYRDRKEDLTALLDQLLAWDRTAGSPWEGRLDPEKVGAMGHSLGGYTVLGLAGGWPAWKEPRLKAGVLFSPFAQPFTDKPGLAKVTIPVMLQGGTLDPSITPFLPPIYRQLGGPKVLLVLKLENHFGWTNLAALGKTTTAVAAEGNPELMVRFTVAFFDQHLRGLDRAALLERGDPRLESYRSQKK